MTTLAIKAAAVPTLRCLGAVTVLATVVGCVSTQQPQAETSPLGSAAAVTTGQQHTVGQVEISLPNSFAVQSGEKKRYGWPWAASVEQTGEPSTLVVINPDYPSHKTPAAVLKDIQTVIATKASNYATKAAQPISVAGSGKSLLQDFSYSGDDGTQYAGSYLASCASAKTGDENPTCFVVRITGEAPLDTATRNAVLKSVTWVPKSASGS